MSLTEETLRSIFSTHGVIDPITDETISQLPFFSRHKVRGLLSRNYEMPALYRVAFLAKLRGESMEQTVANYKFSEEEFRNIAEECQRIFPTPEAFDATGEELLEEFSQTFEILLPTLIFEDILNARCNVKEWKKVTEELGTTLVIINPDTVFLSWYFPTKDGTVMFFKLHIGLIGPGAIFINFYSEEPLSGLAYVTVDERLFILLGSGEIADLGINDGPEISHFSEEGFRNKTFKGSNLEQIFSRNQR
jgi:hypothetical protein